MKTLLVVISILLVGFSASAECLNEKGEDILDQPEVFTALIQKAESCYQAKTLAEACSWGSTIDVYTVDAAYGVCDRELQQQKPSEKLTQLLTAMENTCAEKYQNQSGSMYLSMNAYCHLSAIEWVLNIATPN